MQEADICREHCLNVLACPDLSIFSVSSWPCQKVEVIGIKFEDAQEDRGLSGGEVQEKDASWKL